MLVGQAHQGLRHLSLLSLIKDAFKSQFVAPDYWPDIHCVAKSGLKYFVLLSQHPVC